ncbi:CLUMA_CG009490, isoform A [Clunio marinus]|uniref:CLUMA_CG009490, isoform A n=1 Tax=Clunio marinus TaxID=568069 RepID=A0A1J1I6Z8_9DIPT|nr:CLUMA_CG009490, isoform A [Clunio marinus]
MKIQLLRIIFLVIIGVRNLKAEDEVTEMSSVTLEPSIISEKIDDAESSGRNDDATEENELEARLPSDSQSIRSEIIDTKFSCTDREPGYYADVDNECQIFHRCLEGQQRVFSFICPDQTVFSQRVLVCVWNDTKDFDCEDSEDYFEESNRAFSGNSTAEMAIHENLKNSTEISNMENNDADESDQTKNNLMSEDIKMMEIMPTHDFEIIEEKTEVIEKSSVEENVEEETEESNEYQAELIPNSQHDHDASIAASTSELDVTNHPQKISLSILDPIIEMPSLNDQLQMSEQSRNIRKRSGNHRRRFLFKADAQ